MVLKRFAAMLLTAAMVAGSSVSVFAATTSYERSQPSDSDGSNADSVTTTTATHASSSSVKGSTSVSFAGLIPADSSQSNTGANAGTWYYNPNTGDWKYRFNDGSGAVGWQQLPWTVNGQTQNLWYYFDGAGVMMDGNQVIAGTNYYLNPEHNGWRGGMVDAPANNASVAGMVSMGGSGNSGAWNGTWYYSPSANNWKYLYNNGNVAVGWNQLSWTANGVTRNDWYFFNQDGWMNSGLVNLNGSTYYLNPVSDGFKGAMVTGQANVNGKQMNFANSGELMN